METTKINKKDQEEIDDLSFKMMGISYLQSIMESEHDELYKRFCFLKGIDYEEEMGI